MRMFRRHIAIITLLALLLGACSKQPNRGEVVTKLKSSAKLATVEYVLTKVVKAEKNNMILPNSYFFAHTEAIVKAGIDLNKLKEEDIKIEGEKISLLLPPIEILNFSYPADSFRLEDKYTTKPGLFSRQFSLEQIDELYRQGESSIRENLKDLGIVETAQNNTRTLIEKMLRAAGLKEIYIEFKPNKELTSDFDSIEEDDKTTEE